jgi:antitoxin MazE
MRVAKWGNSLAIRLPAEVIETVKWGPGEELQISVVGKDEIRIVRDRRRQRALEKFRKHRVKYDGRFVFDRDEIYGR